MSQIHLFSHIAMHSPLSSVAQCFFEFLISFFLNVLSPLQLFDQLHLQHLHLHHLLLLDLADAVLLVHLPLELPLYTLNPSPLVLLDLELAESLLLVNELVFEFVFLFQGVVDGSFSVFILLFHHFRLLGLFLL